MKEVIFPENIRPFVIIGILDLKNSSKIKSKFWVYLPTNNSNFSFNQFTLLN